MSDNALVCIVFAAMIAGCSTCSVSKNRKEVEIEKIRAAERAELMKLKNAEVGP